MGILLYMSTCVPQPHEHILVKLLNHFGYFNKLGQFVGQQFRILVMHLLKCMLVSLSHTHKQLPFIGV